MCIIAAAARNLAIGRDGRLPWRLRRDMTRFRAATMGRPVIMGRRTFEEIGRPLAGRIVVVISSRRRADTEGISWAASFDEALARGREAADRLGSGEIMVAGGAAVYAAALPVARRLLLTTVEAEVAGDAFFPAIDRSEWTEVGRESFPCDADNEFAVTFSELRRR